MNKTIIGTVVSTKMQNTISVLTEKKFRHALYKKIIIRHKKIKAHCEDKGVKEGDIVLIQETKPLSKDKHFFFVKKLHAGETAEVKHIAKEVEEVQVAESTQKMETPATKKPVKKTAAKKTVKKAAKKA